MNDERNGQLTADWLIPEYAQGMLWLESETGDVVPAEGENGLFTLDMPSPLLTLRWGGLEGLALAQLRWQPDTLEWDGRVKLGGYVDALHVTELDGTPIAVMTIGGQALRADYHAYPGRVQRAQVPYPFPDFDAALSIVGDAATTWLAPDDSPLTALAQDALVSKLPVHVYGRLSDEEDGWHNYIALPLLLESLTLFAP